MRETIPVSLTAAAVSLAPQLDQVPSFDWKQILWAVASALIAAGLDWLRRRLAPPQSPPGDYTKNPPT